MLVVFLLFIALFFSILRYGPGLAIRAMARLPFRYTFTPENTFALVVTDEEDDATADATGEDANRGGNLVKIVHGITGKWIDTSKPSPMDWQVKDGPDPAHDDPLYKSYGVQDMGSVWNTTRRNVDRRMRFAREDAKPAEDLHTLTKAKKTRNVFYTGELTVVVKEADTSDKLGVNFEIDFAFARRFPVRSVVKLADAAAFLTSLVKNTVNSATVGLPAGAFIGGEGTPVSKSTLQNREDLVKAIESNKEFSRKILKVVGLDITAVSMRDVSMTLAHRALLEKEVTAEKTARADMIKVRNDAAQTLIKGRAKKKVDTMDNDVAADRVQRVIKPAAENERTVAVRYAEVIEKNKTITHVTYAPGANNTVVPVGGNTP